jgi:hypothetical protein
MVDMIAKYKELAIYYIYLIDIAPYFVGATRIYLVQIALF